MASPDPTAVANVAMRSSDSSSSKVGEPLNISVEPMHTDEGAKMEKTVHVRRIFSYAQFFAFSLAYMGVWEGVCV